MQPVANEAPEGYINVNAQLHKHEYSKDRRNPQPIGLQQGQPVAILKGDSNDTLLPYAQCIVHPECLRTVDPDINKWNLRLVGYGVVAENEMVQKGSTFSVQIAGASDTTKLHTHLGGFVHVRMFIAKTPDNKWYLDLRELDQLPDFDIDNVLDPSVGFNNAVLLLAARIAEDNKGRTPASLAALVEARKAFSQALLPYFREMEEQIFAKTITGGEEDTKKRILFRNG